jgi:hypothetical protein
MIWYDESPSWLAAATAGIGRIADMIVAVDGAYALYPGARPRSHPEQAEAIQSTAESMNMGCTVHRPKDVFWGNEVEKRNLSLQLAKPHMTAGEDWILILDADYHVMLLEYPELVRQTLETTEAHAVTYTLLDGKDLLADEGMAKTAAERPLSTDWTLKDRGIFRWADDIRYGPSHYFLRGTYDGEEVFLRGPDLFPSEASRACDVEHLGRNLVMVHRTQQRALVRKTAAEGYYRLRDESGCEEITVETVRAA